MEKFKLGEHQKYALQMMEANKGLMCAYEAGCGKTQIALEYAYKHLKMGDFRNGVLVVCPASLVESWKQAIEDVVKFEGHDSHTVKLLKDNLTIRSFQKTYRTTKVPIGKNGGSTTYRRKIELRDDVDKPWSCLIVDEAHQCSSHSAVQTKSVITLAKISDHVMSLTGTPLHGGKGKPAWQKLYGEIMVVSRGTAFRNWSEFSNKAVLAVDKWYNPVEFNEEYCRKLMNDWCIVCKLEDCVDMPDKIDQDIKCPLAEKAMYQDIGQGNIEKYGLDIQNAGGQYTKMLQICSGSMKVDDKVTLKLKTSKDDALADILNGTEKPVVIFCNYRASVDKAEAVAKKAGRKVVVFDGRSKRETWKDFQNGMADCIVCQYQSGGVGLNLQRSSIEILYEPCYSALLLTQAKGRIFRTGQTQKCVYYFLCTPGTIEKKVWDTVRSGKDVTDKLLAEWAISKII